MSVDALHHVRLPCRFYKPMDIGREFASACLQSVVGCERDLTILRSANM